MTINFNDIPKSDIIQQIESMEWLEMRREVAIDIAKVLPDTKTIDDILLYDNNQEDQISELEKLKENLKGTLDSHIIFLRNVMSFEKINPSGLIYDKDNPYHLLSERELFIVDAFYEVLELSGLKTKFEYVKDVRDYVDYRIKSIKIARDYIKEKIKKAKFATIH